MRGRIKKKIVGSHWPVAKPPMRTTQMMMSKVSMLMVGLFILWWVME